MGRPFEALRIRKADALLWTPSYLSVQPAYWLDDSSSITGTTNASSWSNIGTVGGACGQSNGGQQPTVVASGLNSRRTLSWDGTDDCHFDNSAGARAIMQNSTGGCLFAVIKRNALDGSPTQRNLFTFTTNAGAARFLCGMSTVAVGAANKPYLAVRRADGDSEGLLTAASATPDTNYHMYMWNIDFASRTGRIWLDGINTDTSAATLTTAGSNSSNTASDRPMTLLAYPNATGSNPAANGFGNVGAAAFVVLNYTPGTSDRQKMEGWAAWRYNLVSLLDVSHPYKTSPPTV